MSAGTVVAGMREDDEIEKLIKAEGATAPRVTPDHIESVIASEHYFTAKDGVDGAFSNACTQEIQGLSPDPLRLLTFCVLVLKNGFTVSGESACASPENFRPNIGREAARRAAVNKLWMLEGYLLKQQLYNDEVLGLLRDHEIMKEG